MWATLHTFEHNNLDGMTLIRAPKYGQNCFDHGHCVFTEIPRVSAQNVPTSNYSAGLFERVTTE